MNEQQFQLIVSKGPEPGKIFELSSVTMTIGRDPLSEITINDPEVSRRHANLVATFSGYQIQDLGSTNGTFVDGIRLGGEAVDLQPGQLITIGGGVALRYEQAAVVDEQQGASPVGEAAESEPSPSGEEPQLVADEIIADDFDAVTTLFSEEEEIDYSGIEANDEVDDHLSQDLPPPGSASATGHDEAEFTEETEQAESYTASEFSDPVVIPHEGEPAPAEQNGPSSNYRRLSIIIASVLLTLVCCCCGFLLFLYYIGGDWLLRQMGLLP